MYKARLLALDSSWCRLIRLIWGRSVYSEPMETLNIHMYCFITVVTIFLFLVFVFVKNGKHIIEVQYYLEFF